MAGPNRPNVILICADQWRGDCLGIDGHPVVSTPFLDKLALRGTRFTRAYSPAPTCIPARASLYTGLNPRNHGRVGYEDGVAWTYERTLAESFTRDGYQTQAVGKLHVYPERLQMGFQNVVLHDGYLHYRRKGRTSPDLVDDYLPWLRSEVGREASDFDHGLNANALIARPWDKAEYTHPTNFVASQSIDFLRRRDPTKPFFLFMSFHRPHPPLDPPAWAFGQYLGAEMPSPPVGDWVGHFERYASPHRPDLSVGRIDPRRLHRARAAYFGLMTHIDHQINRFLEALQDAGELDDTYVCFVSDHGEMLGDHEMFRKAVPYEGSARVPLVLVGPKGGGISKGAAVDDVVGLQDVMPTLLECAGIDVPDALDGRSLLPRARGRRTPPREMLHGEHVYGDGSIHWLTNGTEKYVWFSDSGHEQLFDLSADPRELHDRARDPDAAEDVAEWRRRLIAQLADAEEGFSDGERLVPGRPVAPVLSSLRAPG